MLILHAKTLRLPGIAHGFFGRQGGVSERHLCLAQLRPGLGRRAAPRSIENRRRAMRGARRRSALVTLYQIHSPPGRDGRRTLGRSAEPQGRRHGDEDPRHCARHSHRRLRAGAARRCRGRGDRRGACRLERRARRRRRIDGRRHGDAWRARASASPPPSGPASPRRITKWAREFRARFRGRTTPAMPDSSSPTPARATSTSIWKPYVAARLAHAGIAKVSTAFGLHLCARGRFFQFPPRHSSRRKRLWPRNFGDRADAADKAVYPPPAHLLKARSSNRHRTGRARAMGDDKRIPGHEAARGQFQPPLWPRPSPNISNCP